MDKMVDFEGSGKVIACINVVKANGSETKNLPLARKVRFLRPRTWAAVLKPAQCRWVPSRLLSKSTDLARHDGHKRSAGSHCKGVRSKQTTRHVPGYFYYITEPPL